MLMLSTLLFSVEVFDISNAKFGAYSFDVKTKMKIYKNNFTAFNLPIKITSRTEALKETKTGHISKSTVNIAFTALKNDKMSIKTQRLIEYNAHHQIRRLTEVIDRNAETQTIVCTPIREELLDENYKKELGYKSDVVILNCDDNNQMKIQSNLQKSPTKGMANFTTKKNFMMQYNGINYKIEETNKMTIDENGTIQKISKKVKVKDLFSLKYKTKNIMR